MSRSRWSSATLTLMLITTSAGVSASPAFPSTLRTHLNLSYEPPCTLCHATLQGGGPVVTLFGRAMLQRGLTGGNTASLTSAVDRLITDGVDSDGDGMLDVDELLAGTDPNSTEPTRLSDVPPLEYGCVGRVAPGGGHGSWPAIAAIGALLLAFGARRRRPT